MTQTTNLSRYRRTLKTYTIIVIVLCAAMSISALSLYHDVNTDWKHLSTQREDVIVNHGDLVQELGYGGLIPLFKELIITKDISYERSIRIELQQIYPILKKFSKNNPEYDEYITPIHHLVKQYEYNTTLAIELITQGQISSEEIYNQLPIDDTEALSSLIMLKTVLMDEVNLEHYYLSKKFNFAILMHLISVFLFSILLWMHFTQMSKSNKKEQHLADKAFNASKIKSDFLANMSHEIRTPLNGVMGMLHILRRDMVDTKQLHRIERALFSTKSVLTVLNDILDFSKIEANQLSLENANFCLSSVIESVVSCLLPLAHEREIYLKVDIPDDLPTSWVGDSVRINQVLLNIVSNAVKFTVHGGVTIKVNHNAGGLVFTVIDTGIGMVPNTIDLLFDRFSQANTSITREFGGTGLGMSIVKNLVNLMKGTIDVRSEYGIGTTVTIWLPLHDVPTNIISTSVDNSSTVLTPTLNGKTILVAEDNEINRTIVETMLEHTGATIILACDGHQALDIYFNNDIDFIFMDIHMPNIDGIQACMTIRKVDKHIPVIALTANIIREEVESYYQTGFTDHVGKPFDMSDLYNALITYLKI